METAQANTSSPAWATATTIDEFLSHCMVASEAMAACFDVVEERDDRLFATCCGQPVKMWSGILGTDCARCEVCKSEMRMILSPHTSPVLVRNNCTHIPDEEFVKKVGEKCWCVHRTIPKAVVQ